MRALVLRAPKALGVLLAACFAAAFPGPVDAACGGGDRDEVWLARYAARHADTIVLGRLIERDTDHNYHFEVVEVYLGEAASPIINGWPESHGVVDAGGCTGRSVEPGRLFVYVEGDRERFGLMQLIFPHDPGHGFIVSHHRAYRSLDGLLALLGVLPSTSTVQPIETPNVMRPGGWFALIPALAAFALVLLAPPRRPLRRALSDD